jgi:hypothetical protein
MELVTLDLASFTCLAGEPGTKTQRKLAHIDTNYGGVVQNSLAASKLGRVIRLSSLT